MKIRNLPFPVGIVLFGVVGFLVFNLASSLLDGNQKLNALSTYYDLIEVLRMDFRMAIIEQRDYFLTSNEVHKEKYLLHKAKVFEDIAEVDKLIQRANFSIEKHDKLVQYIQLDLALMDSMFIREKLPEEERDLTERTNQIYNLVTVLITEVEANIQLRTGEFLSSSGQWARNIKKLMASVYIFGFILLFISHIQLRKENKKRRMAEYEIRKQAIILNESNRTKDRFFSILAHDLKTPFTYLYGFTEILHRKLKSDYPEELAQLSSTIHTGTKNILNLLQNLLEWVKIHTGNLQIISEHLNLHDLVEETYNLYRSYAESKKTSLSNAVPKDLIVFADRNILFTSLRNLVSNAIKFTFPDGSIHVEALNDHDQTRIVVRDTGVGMDAEMLDALFRIDVKFSQKGTKNEKGSGLGMILVHELIQKAGGTITASSTPGHGTTFEISIPKSPPGPEVLS